jgi:hypothetical protein
MSFCGPIGVDDWMIASSVSRRFLPSGIDDCAHFRASVRNGSRPMHVSTHSLCPDEPGSPRSKSRTAE